MAASTVIKNLNDGTITLSDGTGSPVTLVVPFSTGDLSVSGLAEQQNEVAKYETRGTFHSARHTVRSYPSGSFSFQMADYSDATSTTAYDFIRKTNSYSANVSTLGANADVYSIDIILTVEGTDHGDASDHTLTLTNCACTMDISEGDPNTGTINFECLGTVTAA
jgi:hypothetical protein